MGACVVKKNSVLLQMHIFYLYYKEGSNVILAKENKKEIANHDQQ
jgi:hypothetical protein